MDCLPTIHSCADQRGWHRPESELTVGAFGAFSTLAHINHYCTVLYCGLHWKLGLIPLSRSLKRQSNPDAQWHRSTRRGNPKKVSNKQRYNNTSRIQNQT